MHVDPPHGMHVSLADVYLHAQPKETRHHPSYPRILQGFNGSSWPSGKRLTRRRALLGPTHRGPRRVLDESFTQLMRVLPTELRKTPLFKGNKRLLTQSVKSWTVPTTSKARLQARRWPLYYHKNKSYLSSTMLSRPSGS